MKSFVAALLFLSTCIASAQNASVTSLLSKDLPEMPGKEAQMVTVDLPPGEVGAIHRHDAYVFVYVLQGSIMMRVKGGPPVTLGPGQTFYEDPHDIHTVGRNASATQPARFLAFFVENKGEPLVLPVK